MLPRNLEPQLARLQVCDLNSNLGPPFLPRSVGCVDAATWIRVEVVNPVEDCQSLQFLVQANHLPPPHNGLSFSICHKALSGDFQYGEYRVRRYGETLGV